MFLRLGYQRFVSEFSVAKDMVLKEKNQEITQAQETLLKRVAGSGDLEMSWSITCANLSFCSSRKENVESARKWQKSVLVLLCRVDCLLFLVILLESVL